MKVLDRREADDSGIDSDPRLTRWQRRQLRRGKPLRLDGKPRLRSVRFVIRLGLLAVALMALYVGITLVQVWRASLHDSRPNAEAIVVLGAAQYNGKPSPVLQARLEHALELYRDGVAPVVVVTGGKQSGDRFTEATSGYNWLRRHGVPDSALRKEVKGRSTWESLSATARFLKVEGIDEVVLVSTPSHAYRLMGIAKEVGLEAHVSPAYSLSGPATIRSLARETVAVSAGRLIGYGRLGRLDSVR